MTTKDSPGEQIELSYHQTIPAVQFFYHLQYVKTEGERPCYHVNDNDVYLCRQLGVGWGEANDVHRCY